MFRESCQERSENAGSHLMIDYNKQDNFFPIVSMKNMISGHMRFSSHDVVLVGMRLLTVNKDRSHHPHFGLFNNWHDLSVLIAIVETCSENEAPSQAHRILESST